MFDSPYDIVTKLAVLRGGYGVPADQICVGGGGALVCMDLRESTQDLNVWVDEPYFTKIADYHKVICHPMADTVVAIPEEKIYVRKRNRYFKSVWAGGVQVFDPLTLMIHKRGGYMEVRRPIEKREQDLLDIRQLEAVLYEKNKVRA